MKRPTARLPERICPSCADPLRALRSYQHVAAIGRVPRQLNMYACDTCRTGRIAAHPYGELALTHYYPIGLVPPDAPLDVRETRD